MKFYMNDDTWKPYDDNSTRKDIKRLFNDGPDETTIHYHPRINNGTSGYYLLQLTIFSANVYIRTAPRPEGPWSGPRPIYTIQEYNATSDTTCYAAKSHPELVDSAAPVNIKRPPGKTRLATIIFSYMCNSPITTSINPPLYTPQFIKTIIYNE